LVLPIVWEKAPVLNSITVKKAIVFFILSYFKKGVINMLNPKDIIANPNNAIQHTPINLIIS
jgi:hypothetical protein